MSYGVSSVYGKVGSGGGSGSPASITISTSEFAPTSILVTRSAPTSGILQTWMLEYKRWNDVDWTTYADDLTGLTQTVADLVPYDPETDPDPLVTPLYSFRATALVVVETPEATATGSTTEAPPPPARVPQRRYIWAAGATQGANNYGPSGGETYSTVRMAFKNISGGSMTKLRAGFLTGKTPGATISKLFFSTDGNTWTQMQFGGATSYTEAGSIVGGADQSSLVAISDALTLPAPVAANSGFQLSIVTPASGPAALPLTQFTTGVTGVVTGFAYRKNGDFGNQSGWTGFDEITYGPLQTLVMEYA